MPVNVVQARVGKFLTRNSRKVEITGFKMVPYKAPRRGERRVWDGNLFQQDGRRVETRLTWEDDGSLCDRNGVASPYDLTQCIGAPDPPPPTGDGGELAAIEATIARADVGIERGDRTVSDWLAQVLQALLLDRSNLRAILKPFAEDGESVVDTVERLLYEGRQIGPQVPPIAPIATTVPLEG